MKQPCTFSSPFPTQLSLLVIFGKIRWPQCFLCEQDGPPHHHYTNELPRGTFWIGLTLVLLALNEWLPLTPSAAMSWLPSLVTTFAPLLPCLFTAGSFLTLWQALRPGVAACPPRACRGSHLWMMSLLGLAAIGSVISVTTVVFCFLPPHFSNDGASIDTNAAILLLHGRNPYTDSSILDVARRFSISPDWTTPLRAGAFTHRLNYPSSAELHAAFAQAQRRGVAPEFESKVSYPALSFLLLVPFAFFEESIEQKWSTHCLLIAQWRKRQWRKRQGDEWRNGRNGAQ